MRESLAYEQGRGALCFQGRACWCLWSLAVLWALVGIQYTVGLGSGPGTGVESVGAMKGSGVGEVSESFVPTRQLSHAEEQVGFPYGYAITSRAQ